MRITVGHVVGVLIGTLIGLAATLLTWYVGGLK